MKKEYKQGQTFPPSGRGGGIFLIILGIFIIYVNYFRDTSTHTPTLFILALLFIFTGVWIIYSTTSIVMDKIDKGVIIKRYGTFPIKIDRQIRLWEYDAAVIKTHTDRYSVMTEMGATGFISDNQYSMSYVGLFLKQKGKLDLDLVIKGRGKELLDFVKEHLLKTDLIFFLGTIKKEYRLQRSKIERFDFLLDDDSPKSL